MKKIICLAVIFVLCFATVCSAQVKFERTEFDKSGSQSLEMLTSLGIIDEDGAKNIHESVSRADFVAMLLCVTNDDVNKIKYSERIFSDVSSGTAHSDSIMTAYRLGFISRAQEFRPADEVTLSEALTFTVKALGYEPYAQNKGGYPSGYALTADRIGLLENIDSDLSETLSAGQAYILLQNALEADIMEITSYGDRVEMNAETGKNLLSQRFSVKTAEAVIEANSRTDLYSADSALKDGQLMAGGVVYGGASPEWEDMLGSSAKLYYSDNGGSAELKFVCLADGDNKTVKIPADDFDSLDGNSIKYYDGTKTRSVTLSDSAVLIFNGKMAPLSESRLKSEFGSIELVSNDGDDKYDVIFAAQYTPYVVSAASSRGVVGTRDGISLKFEANDPEHCTVMKKGTEYISCADIAAGDVLMYAESETGTRKVITAIVSSNSVSGTAESVDESDDIVTIDGKTTKCSKEVMAKVCLGAQVTLYIDGFGKAVYCDVASDRVYGYLNGMKEDVFGTHSVRIFTENNRWVTLSFAKTVKVNGTAMNEDEAEAYLGSDESEYRQLIRYNVDSHGQITLIDTAADMTAADDDAAIDNDVFRISDSGKDRYRLAVNSFNGKSGIKDGAKIFVVPSQGSGTDEYGFDIISSSSLSDNTTYTYTAYDSDKVHCSSVFVLTDFQRTYNNDLLIVFRNLVRTLNSDGMAVNGVVGWYNGNRITLPAELIAESAVKSVDELKPGDIFRFTVSKNSSLEKISRIYTQGTPYSVIGDVWSSSGFVTGTVKHADIENGKILVQYTDSGSCIVYSLNGISSVGIYEADDNTFSYGTLADINDGDQIAAGVGYMKFKNIFIIRD